MRSVLVLGDDSYRSPVAVALETSLGATVVECDPAAGDCVMYVRLEGMRYEAFVFVGYDQPVTRGALASFRSEDERETVLRLFPGAASVPNAVIGGTLDDAAALSRLVSRVTAGRWQWQKFIARVNGEIGRSG